MAIDQAAGLDEGDRRQSAVLDVCIEIRRVLDVRGADGGIGHDRRVVLEGVADVAVFIGLLADRAVVQLIRIVERSYSTGRRSTSRRCSFADQLVADAA